MPLTSTQSSFDDTHISIPLGIVIGLLASFIQSLGLTIQRKSHVINQSLPQHSQLVEHRRPLWLLGFSIFILSNLIGSLVQIASLPVVILAPLGAVSLLWNAFFARLILGDVFSLWMILGTVLIAGGAALIAIFGIVPEPTHSLEDLLELLKRPAFVIYFSLLGMVVFACLAVTHVGEYSWSRRISKALESESSPPLTTARYDISRPHIPELNNTAFTTSDYCTLTERTSLLHRKKDQSHSSSSSTCNTDLDPVDRMPILIAVSYASISGIISGMCLIFAKSGVELLLLTIRGQNQFRRWESWALVAGLIVFALLQLWYLHKALILANPTLVCPSAFCFYNLSSIVNGLIYFNQLRLIELFHLCLVASGVIILLGGVWVVSVQSGGGGVDVGTWNEEEQDISDGDTGASTDDLEQDNVPPLDPWHRESGADSPVRALNHTPVFSPESRETRSESYITLPTSSNISSPEIGASSSRSPLPPRHRTHSMNLYMIPRSPPAFQTRVGHRRATVESEIQQISHRRNASHPSNVFSPPLNNAVSTLGAGLQIGLSPVSPGFIIVPRERRRRSSVVENSNDVEQDSQSLERRTVSEGDTRAPLARSPCTPTSDEAMRGPPSSENLGRRRGRAPWRYLRGILKTIIHIRS